MKKIVLLIPLMFISIILLAQNEEEIAIRKVLDNESKFARACDFENWANQWWHDDYVFYSYTHPNYYLEKKGWEDLNSHVINVLNEQNCNTNENVLEKWDINYTIKADMAFVTAKIGNKEFNVANEISCALEKRNDQWKFIRFNVVAYLPMELDKKKKKLSQFVGEWNLDLKSFKQNPEEKGSTLVGSDMKIKISDAGIKFKYINKWTRVFWEERVHHYKGEISIVSKWGEEEFAVMESGANSFNWTLSRFGKAFFEEDNIFVVKYYDGLDEDKVVSKWTVEMMDQNTMHSIFHGVDEKGEPTWRNEAIYYRKGSMPVVSAKL